jgi:hypothetical protein
MRPRVGAGLGWFAYRCCESFLTLEREGGGTGEQFHPPMSANGAQKYGDVRDPWSPVTTLYILPPHGPGGAPDAGYPLYSVRY